MGSDLNVCANIIRFLVVIINILFVILGIILIGIGSWGIAVDSDFSFVTGSSIASGAALLIIAGIVTVLVCATGIIGAIFKLRPLLVIYAIILTIIVILEIVGGILAFVFSSAVVSGLEEGSLNAIRLYPANLDDPSTNSTQRDARTAVDAVQSTLRCCGVFNATDWPRENLNVFQNNQDRPPQVGGCTSCTVGNDDENCMQFNGSYVNPATNLTVPYGFTASRIGCVGRLEDNLVLIGSVGGGLGVVFGILEITGILFALFLCCCITSARKQEVV